MDGDDIIVVASLFPLNLDHEFPFYLASSSSEPLHLRVLSREVSSFFIVERSR